MIGWTNAHDVSGVSLLKTNWAINANNFRTITNTANVSASPWSSLQGGGAFLKSSPNASILVDTYGSSSTVTAEYFIDENRRQGGGYNANDPNGNWDSSQPLQVGEAMVFKGQLISPDEADFVDWTDFSPSGNPDYTGLTVPVSYFRTFVDGAGSSRSSMSVSLSGTFVGGNALADLESENLKIFIRRRASAAGGDSGAAAAALRLHGSLYNFAFFDDGQSDIGSGIREATSNGNTINATFGGFSCETGILMEIQIANTNVKLNSVIVTFI